jgi:two-component system chemotaxis response regulator CheB
LLKKKVLIVDDSAFMRRIIRQMVESEPTFEVVGTARDGLEGVELALELKPDVITMDVEMPRMNGLEATEAIMAKHPTPILIVSSLTTEGAQATLDALDKGAVDFLAKNLVSSALDVMKIRDELVDKLKLVARSKGSLARRTSTPKKSVGVVTPSASASRKTFATQPPLRSGRR